MPLPPFVLSSCPPRRSRNASTASRRLGIRLRCATGASHARWRDPAHHHVARVEQIAHTARQRIRLEGGGYRRDHLRALAQRVEFADGEVRIMGSKTRLLQALTGKNGVNSVPTQGLKWRRGWDSNPRYALTHNGFRDRPDRPLRHLSVFCNLIGRAAMRGNSRTSRAITPVNGGDLAWVPD